MFRKFFSVASALVLFFSSSICCFAETKIIKHNVSVPPEILFLGDSIPAGYGLEGYTAENPYNCDSYANILARRYKDELAGKTDFRMTNSAVPGLTSDGLLKNIRDGLYDKDLKTSSAVVISIGGNDILHLLYGCLGIDFRNQTAESSEPTDTKSFSTTLKNIADNIKNLSADADKALKNFDKTLPEIVSEIHKRSGGQIVIQTLYNPMENFTVLEPLQKLSTEKIGLLNEKIKEYSEKDGQENYIVTDVAENFKGKAEQLTNINRIDIHPNADGHWAIADCIDETIRTKTYYYTETVEIPEETKTEKSITPYIIIGVSVLAVIVAVSLTFIIKHKKRERTKL